MSLRATGIGSMPGEDAAAYAEAVRMVLGELPDLPFVPELPARGATAGITGRGVAVLADLGADLQPAGWRLTDAPGVDQRRARSLLAQDLDCVEELAVGLTTTLKLQIAGPWTLAATIERPRGDKVLADHGARRDLAQSLAEGLSEHVREVRRRVPDAAGIIVQLDEPALPAVLAAQVPTASGFGRHRSVEPPVAAQALEWCLEAARAAGAQAAIVHCCAPRAPLGLIRQAGADGFAVDADLLDADGLDEVGAALESDGLVLLGIAPTSGEVPTERGLAERTERLLDMLGIEPGDHLVLTPACGLAGSSSARAKALLGLLARVGRI